MKGHIFYEGKRISFKNLRELSFHADGKSWVYARHTESELRFKIAPMGGASGTGNYLKAWRKRMKFTQAAAAKHLKTIAPHLEISQSLIARIESGDRPLKPEIFNEIRKNTSSYGRK